MALKRENQSTEVLALQIPNKLFPVCNKEGGLKPNLLTYMGNLVCHKT